ncbi:MAG: translesion DNA synthesis-associated protein ImuA [Tepidimonas sp.]|uniref:translesion DNA synthesis-associated protein ImuA n=1 Tax=Tepidimonas sp. TaxID=2002775 RepID=UPI0040550527
MTLSCLRHDVWWADQVGPAEQPTVSTEWPALDAVLPGNGWPLGAVIECALQTDALPWRLLLPALRAAACQGPVVLIGLPLELNAPAWAAQGVDTRRLLRLQPASDADALWAAEQVLRCPDVALCWVHWRRPTAGGMRRLQLAAATARRDGTQPEAWPAPLVLASHDAALGLPASAAPLRLAVAAGDVYGLAVRIRKRRGPPLAEPVWLDAPLPLHRLLAPLGPKGNAPHATEHPVDRLPAHLRLALP